MRDLRDAGTLEEEDGTQRMRLFTAKELDKGGGAEDTKEGVMFCTYRKLIEEYGEARAVSKAEKKAKKKEAKDKPPRRFPYSNLFRPKVKPAKAREHGKVDEEKATAYGE